MNIVLKYAKYTTDEFKYKRVLFEYRSDYIIKSMGVKNPFDAFRSCAKKLPLNKFGQKIVKDTCDGGFLSDCDKCWINILEHLEDYMDKSANLPTFMQQSKKINDRKPSFLKR